MELDPEVVTAEAFSTLLDMIYTSTLPLSASNVMDVLLAASHLHLNAVVKACKIHLSKKNFPTSPPKGWRSMQQHQSGSLNGAVTSVMEEDMDVEEVGAEVSQSSGREDQEVGTKICSEQSTSSILRHKRKSNEHGLSSMKRSCRLPECSPTVTRSTTSAEEGGDELLFHDCLKTTDGSWEGMGEEEEKKYEATKGESEEIELPSQSDSSSRGVGAWEKLGDAAGCSVVKVKVGEEGENDGEESKMVMIEVKKENLNSCTPDLDTAPNRCLDSPPSPPKDFLDSSDTQFNNEKMATCPTEIDGSSLQSQLCSDLQTDAQREAGGLGEESADADEGLDSLSELAFSCFLNPSSDSVLGALEIGRAHV